MYYIRTMETNSNKTKDCVLILNELHLNDTVVYTNSFCYLGFCCLTLSVVLFSKSSHPCQI